MNIRKAKKIINHNKIILMWFNSFITNSRALINFGELVKNDNINNDLYMSSMKVLADLMEFDLSKGYDVAKRRNISKKQYIKVIYGKCTKIKA